MFGTGGVYDAGASQFAGGGFMTTQAQDKYETTPAQEKRGSSSQTLRAVTVKQLVKDVANSDDDVFKVDGVELNNVTIVGQVLTLEDSNTRVLVTIDDGTGTVEVMQWKNGDETDWVFNQQKAEWQNGVYVRVYGHMRSFERKKSIMAYNIRTVHDYNEVVHHFLQCIFQHLHLTKGAPTSTTMAARAGPMSTPVPGSAPPSGGFGGAASAWQTTTPSAGGAGGAPANQGPQSGMTPVQRETLQVCSLPEMHPGLTVEQMHANLAGKFPLGQLQAAVDFLLGEGYIYNTIDDVHFKSAQNY